MSQFQIVFTLITIVYGLVITNLFANLHKLIRAGKKVKWHWLPAATVWYILHVILKNWWNLTATSGGEHWNSILVFIFYAHLLLILFLLVSALLPDTIPEAGINLKEYYLQNHAYIWGLMSTVIVLSVLVSLIRDNINNAPLNTTAIFFNGMILAFTILLVLSKKILVHSITIIMFIAVLIFEIVQ